MWVRLDDGIASHPKFLRAGPEALGLFVAGLCYCNRYRTGGLIPMEAVPHLLPGVAGRQATELAFRLTRNGERPSWIVEGDHYRVHDYDVYQTRLGAEDGEVAKRAQNAERQRRYRERHASRPDSRDLPRDVTRYVTADRCVTAANQARYGLPDRNGDDPGVTARDGDAAGDGVTVDVTPAGASPHPGPLPPPRPVPRSREFSSAPAREERDLDAEFEAWSPVYPRQQGHVLGRQAFAAAAAELPPLAELLAALEAQVAAEPDPRWWRRMDRYLDEHGWRDQPLRAPERERGGGHRRRPSDRARRERLREIGEAAQAAGEEAPDA